MYTSYTSVISVNMHKGNSQPLSQPLTTADKRMLNCKHSKIIISLRDNTEMRRILKGEDYMQ
jgi:hypothetical protein